MRASYNKVGRVVRPTARNRNNMIDVILSTNTSTTVITVLLLALQLGQNILGRMLAYGIALAGHIVSPIRSGEFSISGAPVSVVIRPAIFVLDARHAHHFLIAKRVALLIGAIVGLLLFFVDTRPFVGAATIALFVVLCPLLCTGSLAASALRLQSALPASIFCKKLGCCWEFFVALTAKFCGCVHSILVCANSYDIYGNQAVRVPRFAPSG